MVLYHVTIKKFSLSRGYGKELRQSG